MIENAIYIHNIDFGGGGIATNIKLHVHYRL